MSKALEEVLDLIGNCLEVKNESVIIVDAQKFKKNAHVLAEISALESGAKAGWARFLTRAGAQELGVYPASINELYMARGEGRVPMTFTVPAMNLRMMSFDAASAVFRAANRINASAMIFEIARSEMNYTSQRPAEYSTSILAAAVSEGYVGPVFIQGDHFQVSSKKYSLDPVAEVEALQALMRESISAGFLNIDVDTSTMVDLSKTTVKEQQALNTELSAKFTAYIRSIEPKGVTISVGGEIGEVGGHNSTEEELRAYLDGYRVDLDKLAPKAVGLSKISIQTGTSHGGIVLPDGSIAKVSVDFDTLRELSRIARSSYGMGGAVQHGASTLPEDAFHKFVEAEANEVHLATNFMNIFFDHIPAGLREEMYAYLREKNAADRKPDMTDEQFYYKMRKNAVGPFKKQSWTLPRNIREGLGRIWEDQFTKLFASFNIKNTKEYIEGTINHPVIKADLKYYLAEAGAAEEVNDLAD